MTTPWTDIRATWRKTRLSERVLLIGLLVFVISDLWLTHWQRAFDSAVLLIAWYTIVWQGQVIDEQRAQIRAMR